VIQFGIANDGAWVEGAYYPHARLIELRDALLEVLPLPAETSVPKVAYEVYSGGFGNWNVHRVEYNAAHKYAHISHSNDKATAERIAKALTEAEGL
jgi:hypothetical protein